MLSDRSIALSSIEYSLSGNIQVEAFLWYKRDLSQSIELTKKQLARSLR